MSCTIIDFSLVNMRVLVRYSADNNLDSDLVYYKTDIFGKFDKYVQNTFVLLCYPPVYYYNLVHFCDRFIGISIPVFCCMTV